MSAKEIYILVDYKLSAIIGVFSTLKKVQEAKKALIKRDVRAIERKINEELILSNLETDRKYELVGILNLINYFNTNIDTAWESTVIEWDGICPHSRYGWYRTKVDTFKLEKSTYGPIILIPSSTKTN